MSIDVLSGLWWSSTALAVGLMGCGGRPQESPVTPRFSVNICRPNHPDVGGGDCSTNNCGGNSSIVNTFPINGLSKDGQGACNRSGVQLLPQSLEGGGCGSGSDLGLDPTGSQLVGTRQGKVVCRGEQLTGATFTVRSAAEATLTFTIANVRQFTAAGRPTEYEGYRIESGGDSACESAAALRIRHQLGLPPEEPAVPAGLPLPAPPPGADDDLVIAVDGPIYNSQDQVVEDSRANWFNLACARDALAKRTLYGLYEAGNDARNLTALRMLTANYCGKSYTVPGVELEWREAAPKLAKLEAQWNAGKAICLDAPRLMQLKVGNQRVVPSQLPAPLQPSGCQAQDCDPDGWIRAVRAECRLQPCRLPESGPFEFESYVFADSDKIQVVAARKP